MDQITTYATLQAAVAGMLHRDGDTSITDNAPLFIQLCEADLNDRQLLKDYEQEDTLTCTVSQNYIALPSGYVSPIAAWIVIDTQRVPLQPVLVQELPYDTSNSIPRAYAIDGANLRFDCPADDTYSVPFRYWKASNLSDDNTSNALLLRRPDIYLNGALYQACLYAQDDEGAKKWLSLYEAGIARLKAADSRSRAVPLRTDFGGRRTSILTG